MTDTREVIFRLYRFGPTHLVLALACLTAVVGEFLKLWIDGGRLPGCNEVWRNVAESPLAILCLLLVAIGLPAILAFNSLFIATAEGFRIESVKTYGNELKARYAWTSNWANSLRKDPSLLEAFLENWGRSGGYSGDL